MAKKMAVPLAQRLAMVRYTAFPVFSQHHSAITIRRGMAIPTTAKMM
jgi:hypothetical protein